MSENGLKPEYVGKSQIAKKLREGKGVCLVWQVELKVDDEGKTYQELTLRSICTDGIKITGKERANKYVQFLEGRDMRRSVMGRSYRVDEVLVNHIFALAEASGKPHCPLGVG